MKHNLGLYLKIFKSYINKIQYFDYNELYIYIIVIRIYEFSILCKSSLLFKINSLVDLGAIDWIWRIHRFSVYYNFYSFFYNYRVLVILDVPVFFSYLYGLGIESLSKLFNSANWLERETWDLFGVYFFHHADLRRILTDYGFTGFPFRKDFPISGYKELRYDDTYKIIVSEKIKLMQEYRVFHFINPWGVDL